VLMADGTVRALADEERSAPKSATLAV